MSREGLFQVGEGVAGDAEGCGLDVVGERVESIAPVSSAGFVGSSVTY